jgi:hypothetical protein
VINFTYSFFRRASRKILEDGLQEVFSDFTSPTGVARVVGQKLQAVFLNYFRDVVVGRPRALGHRQLEFSARRSIGKT